MERKVYYRTSGEFPGLTLRTETLPEPQAHEVQVQVEAIGLNFADVFSILGLYEAAPKGEFVPGLEFSGSITKVGSAVNEFRTGQRVTGVNLFGAYADRINVDARYLFPLDDSWSFEEGAAYPVQTLAAYYGLVTLGRVGRGETVLIQSAVGGVGLAALKMAKTFDCHVIGIVGNVSKVRFCEEQGYDAVVLRDGDLKANIRNALGGRNLDVVMECSGGKVFKECLSLLSPEGRMVVYGFSYYLPKGEPSRVRLALKYLMRPRLDIEELDDRSVAVFNLIHFFDKADRMKRLLDEATALGLATPYVARTYSFEELPRAVADLRSGKTIGKLVVVSGSVLQ